MKKWCDAEASSRTRRVRKANPCLRRGRQPTAASARTESPDGHEDRGEVVRVGGPTLNQLFDVLAEWNAELEALDAPELNNLGIEP